MLIKNLAVSVCRWENAPQDGVPHPTIRTIAAGHAGPALQKTLVGRHPCVPPHTACLAKLCHCEPVTDVTGAVIRIPLAPNPPRSPG